MTFSKYLQEQETLRPELSESIIFGTIKAASAEHDDYRSLSLILAEVPILFDEFQRLWDQYESELDRQNFESEQERLRSEPVPVSEVVGLVLDDIRLKTNNE